MLTATSFRSVSARDSSTAGRRVVLATGRDVKPETIAAFAPVASRFEIFDEGLLATNTVPLNVQSHLQTAIAASLAAADAIRRVNRTAIVRVFDPRDDEPVLRLGRAVASSDLSIVLTQGNLLRSLAVGVAARTGRTLLLLNSDIEIECFAAGKNACYACPVRRPAWRIRPGLVPDFALLADFAASQAEPGKTIVARDRSGRPVIVRLPCVRAAVNCPICACACDPGGLDGADFDYHSQADGFYRRADR